MWVGVGVQANGLIASGSRDASILLWRCEHRRKRACMRARDVCNAGCAVTACTHAGVCVLHAPLSCRRCPCVHRRGHDLPGHAYPHAPLRTGRDEGGGGLGAGGWGSEKSRGGQIGALAGLPPPLFFVLQSPCLSSEATGFRRFSVCSVEATISTSDWCPCLCEIESPTVRGSEAASSQNTVCRRHGIEEMKRGEAGTIRGSQV